MGIPIGDIDMQVKVVEQVVIYDIDTSFTPWMAGRTVWCIWDPLYSTCFHPDLDSTNSITYHMCTASQLRQLNDLA